jgi:hypothetical protein
MLGGTAAVAYHAGKGRQQSEYHEAEQDAQLEEMQQQQQAPPQYQQPAPYPTPPPAPAAPVDSAAQRIEALSKLKDLLDAGVLTQAEFDAQKQQLLQG